MCHLINVAALQHEAHELLEEKHANRLISIPVAAALERSWELEAEYNDVDADVPSDVDSIEDEF